MNSVDPGMYIFRSPVDPHSEVAVQDFFRKMDRLLDLLESIADALAAESDLRSETIADEPGGNVGGNIKPTIQ